MPLYIQDLRGMVFNELRVLDLHTYGYGVRTKWNCLCSCGKIFPVAQNNLKRGHTKSCGCKTSLLVDLVGMKFNMLTVTSLHSRGKVARWNCVCECGNSHVAIGSSLKNGGTKSCGCLCKKRKPYYEDMTGRVFTRLTVVSRNFDDKLMRWDCICSCGNKTIVHDRNLKSGHTKSCGCYNLDMLSLNKTKHGCSTVNKRLYGIWNNMMYRCTSPKHHSFPVYGGRGIQACDDWKDCGTFFQWAFTNGYQDDLSIDRINNDGNYEPSNCRWTTKEVQMQNTSRSLGKEKVSRIKELLKEGFSQKVLSEMYNINSGAISNINTGKTYKNI